MTHLSPLYNQVGEQRSDSFVFPLQKWPNNPHAAALDAPTTSQVTGLHRRDLPAAEAVLFDDPEKFYPYRCFLCENKRTGRFRF